MNEIFNNLSIPLRIKLTQNTMDLVIETRKVIFDEIESIFELDKEGKTMHCLKNQFEKLKKRYLW